ncbi:MAG TPA: DnaJ C-terminal domain-containing protein, partial [Rhodospirillales bacterium]|nr:DnaJ C-terminal domain-containing protein [Rhodospirillales bacterium]
GFFTVERTCPSCGGSGQTIRDACRTCGGAGRVQREKTLQVTIPAGRSAAHTGLAFAGEADARPVLDAGDLYIFISVAPHRLFRRDGADIHCRVPLPMTTAALGGSIEVPTINGERARINIPSGTQSGETFRLRNKGMTILRHQARGDMYVEAVVETPVNLTDKQRKLLQEFADAGTDEKTSPESHGFFAKVKELWQDLRE